VEEGALSGAYLRAGVINEMKSLRIQSPFFASADWTQRLMRLHPINYVPSFMAYDRTRYSVSPWQPTVVRVCASPTI